MMKKVKLGYRLQQLKQMVIKDYDHIWDCCCDHGYLGLAILQKLDSKDIKCTVHFVDVIQSLIIQLRQTLERFHSNESNANNIQWQVSCQDASSIKLEKNQTHLVIIAGVGGEKTIQLIQGIINNNEDVDFELLLCPVHQNYLLREFLIQQKFGLIKEKIVRENNRYYELLHVSMSARLNLSLVGSEQWDYSRQNDRDYLELIISHFEQKTKAPQKRTFEILEAYRILKTGLSIR
ncbi:MAG: SAM-dependent methyltransferase [Kangiella sp.]|nr:MAG: SAM-dependent methyltransferase [Kangiella sp.]